MKLPIGWWRAGFFVVPLFALGALASRIFAAEWIERVPLADGTGSVAVGPDGVVYFLCFGRHSFEPDDDIRRESGIERLDPVPIAPFQELAAVGWRFRESLRGTNVRVTRKIERDAFWDQILTVDPQVLRNRPTYKVVEVGEFGGALPSRVRALSLSGADIEAQRQSLIDPVIPQAVDREIPWDELAARAYPLDFQKVLLASRNDSSPGFAFQNGQWLTTWLSRDLPKWTNEDHWFAPALLVGDTLVRPAPLSAETRFAMTEEGMTIPLWTLKWTYQGATITQSMFSHRTTGTGPPRVFVRFLLKDAPAGARLALGVGRRPNVHYWDDTHRERTPIPFFTLGPKYRQVGQRLADHADQMILESAQSFRLESIGPVEMLLVFEADRRGTVDISTPQGETPLPTEPSAGTQYVSARSDFESDWTQLLRDGARARLPSAEWMERIQIWQSQVAAITRVHYEGRERLSYGAYFYQSYFGPEEGWPIVALAQWGHGAEAQRQAEIMLSAENRDKSNVHHQSRNGTAAWYAGEVARLTHDKAWLQKIAPALIENAEWTIAARKSTAKNESPLTRGLLPEHIYGGDVRDGATSLYASATCWKGLVETADVFRTLGSPDLVQKADVYEAEARDFKRRLTEVINEVADRKTTPPFVPFALDMASLKGKNEGPYERLTDLRLGNYWNLFAPSILQLGFFRHGDKQLPSVWVLGYMANHGGLWAGLPRFNAGLDAAYAIGNIGELLEWSARDVRYRNQALASLQSFFLHAASRNGYTIPEVAGLFPYRLDRAAYEQLVRESPWNFGMYDADRYLGGHISFTEPLGAGAGEALWLIRSALISESRDENGLPDGGLILLSTVPSDWFAEGREIVLEDFPTAYGKISIHVRSRIESRGEIEMEYEFIPFSPRLPLKKFTIRFAPSGKQPKDVVFDPNQDAKVRAKF